MMTRAWRLSVSVSAVAIALILHPAEVRAQPSGACCNETSCVAPFNDQEACESAGRTFFPGEDCNPNPCGVTGACCLTIGCFDDFQQSCEQSGGFWAGPNTTCTPTSCVFTACCFPDGGCSTLPISFCAASGGIELEGADCDANPTVCGVGACCTTESICTQFNAHECISNGRDYVAAGVPCNPNPCLACETCPGDLTNDNAVNGADIELFLQCFLEAAGGAPSPDCLCSDMDENGVVDDTDVGMLVTRLLVTDAGC